MNEQQRRVLSYLLSSLDKYLEGDRNDSDIQVDLESVNGAVEDKEISELVEKFSNELDLCKYSYDEAEAKNISTKYAGELLLLIKSKW